MKIRIAGMAWLCITLILVLASQGMAAIDLKNLTGLWMFDEGSGDTSKDLSGNGNDAELISKPKWVAGKFGKALEFDGAASYVEIPDHENPTVAITISAWAMSLDATWSKHGWLVEKRDAYILHPVQATTAMAFCVVNGGPWNLPKTWADGQVSPDDNDITNWHMYTATFDSETGEWKIYIDGEVRSEMDINAAEIALDSGPVFIGNDTCEAGRFGHGVVDEVAIFDVALGEDDIKQIYSQGFEMVQAVSPAGKLANTWSGIKTGD